MADDATAALDSALVRTARRRTRVGLVSGGLAAYWPQFPGLRDQLQDSARATAGLLGIPFRAVTGPGDL
ncbi:hypothetical protein [Streptomyces sp. NBC_00887]|uniref:hypothetical protein n=1 Tax=Streptomyces sp. NBC_00887 TaxID=2975859 RepID=UPI003868D12B|nr:hypothetical protein OG844_11575 [Streptomyces sp. NBC_00887]